MAKRYGSARSLGSAVVLSGVLTLALTFLLWTATPALAAKKKPKSPEDLVNLLLGVEYAHWLVGPIREIATALEIDDFLLLDSDAQAEQFVVDFWAERNRGTPVFQKTPQQIFEARAVDADKRYTEGTYPGSRTDRGTIFILYGEPEEITFEAPRKVGGPTLEVWAYPKSAEPGIHGEKPRKSYRFVEVRGRTVFYTGQPLPPQLPRHRPDF